MSPISSLVIELHNLIYLDTISAVNDVKYNTISNIKKVRYTNHLKHFLYEHLLLHILPKLCVCS